MIVHHGGVQGDVSTARLPADAYPALCAYSLNRKLRKLYNGEYFRYKQASGGEFDYPSNTPNLSEDVYVIRVYDQKAKDGVPVQDLVQSNQNLAPKLGLSANSSGEVVYKAIFNLNEYMELDTNLLNSIDQDFTITVVGEGTDVPRPLIGIEGSHPVTIEPSSLTSRFTFDSNIGAISEQGTGVTQCKSGYDTEELTYKISVRASDQVGYKSMPTLTTSFTNFYVGKHESRFYKGDFSEMTIHLSELTQLGAEQLFSTTRTEYGY